jgi:hypothetical protein
MTFYIVDEKVMSLTVLLPALLLYLKPHSTSIPLNHNRKIE